MRPYFFKQLMLRIRVKKRAGAAGVALCEAFWLREAPQSQVLKGFAAFSETCVTSVKQIFPEKRSGKRLAACMAIVLGIGITGSRGVAAEGPGRMASIVHALKNQRTYDSVAYRRQIRELVIAPKNSHGKPSRLILNLNHSIDLTIQFSRGDYRVGSRDRAVLNDLGRAMQQAALLGQTFLVGGHTDSGGGRSYNQWLSKKRADAVKAWLVQRFRIKPSRLVTAGFGEKRPLDETRPGGTINRRIEISLVDPSYPHKPAFSLRLSAGNYTPPGR